MEVKTMARYTVFQVAKWFLTHDSMTLKRLQKLCYYAQAWYYTLKGKKLMDTDFEAWVHGPVSRDLWNKYRFVYEQYRYMEDIESTSLSDEDDITDPDDIELLELVWNTYGDLTGNALEALTHTEVPWINARAGAAPSEPCSNIISLESMKEYYQTIYENDYGE